jgi:hypothetical protein
VSNRELPAAPVNAQIADTCIAAGFDDTRPDYLDTRKIRAAIIRELDAKDKLRAPQRP